MKDAAAVAADSREDLLVGVVTNRADRGDEQLRTGCRGGQSLASQGDLERTRCDDRIRDKERSDDQANKAANCRRHRHLPARQQDAGRNASRRIVSRRRAKM